MRHDFAFIKSNKKLIKLRFDEVVFIKGLGNYVEIAMSGGEKYVYYRSLKELINSLPEEFMRIHNCFRHSSLLFLNRCERRAGQF